MEKWFLTMKKADFQEIAGRFHISPITARLIRNKDLTTMEEIDAYLNGTISDLYDGMLMKDADKAIDILKEKIAEEKKTYSVTDIADAKDYLADTFGVSRTKMKTKEDVLAVAKEFGVELEGLE